MHAASLAWLPMFGARRRLKCVLDQVANGYIADLYNVATIAAVATVRAALGYELLTAKT
jgi:hypothetical protein